jgi:uncharacterized repeat protein (TIGR03803 family)
MHVRILAHGVVMAGLLLTSASAANIQLLHNFVGGTNDGAYPNDLVLSGTTLYGTTWAGGHESGTLFKVNTDGTGYQLLNEFFAGSATGGLPLGNVIISGTKIYGTTSYGQQYNGGTVYSINTDGTGYQVMHQFLGGSSDGYASSAGLTLVGSTLYGTTREGGGFFNRGTIFSIDTGGSNFNLLHKFNGSPSDGINPASELIVSGSKIFGTTQQGGSNNQGTIFSMNTDGTGFQLLHSFTSAPNDGVMPLTALTLAGSVLYGTSAAGGSINGGTVFAINTDGTGFHLVHSFTDAINPQSTLTLVGSQLYGTTLQGGDFGQGAAYVLNLDGTGYQVIHSFNNNTTTGGFPGTQLVVIGSKLYGTTSSDNNLGYGSVYVITVPEPAGWVSAAAALAALLLVKRRGRG